jgi:hypothetical protein
LSRIEKATKKEILTEKSHIRAKGIATKIGTREESETKMKEKRGIKRRKEKRKEKEIKNIAI